VNPVAVPLLHGQARESVAQVLHAGPASAGAGRQPGFADQPAEVPVYGAVAQPPTGVGDEQTRRLRRGVVHVAEPTVSVQRGEGALVEGNFTRPVEVAVSDDQ